MAPAGPRAGRQGGPPGLDFRYRNRGGHQTVNPIQVPTAPLFDVRKISRIGWPAGVATALIGIFVLAAFVSARGKSVTSDEPPHLAAGLSYWITHEVFRANPEHPPLIKELTGLSLLIGGIRWPDTPNANYLVNGDDPAKVFRLEWPVGLEILRKYGPDRVLLWARVPPILVGGLLGAVLFLWGRRLFGPIAAVAAVFVFLLDPLLLAHTQFVTTDVGSAAFGTLALFCLWNYLGKPNWARLSWTAAAFGCALVAKFSEMLLLPIAVALLVAAWMWPIAEPAPALQPKKSAKQQPKSRRLPLWVAFLIVCGGAFLVVQIAYFLPDDVTMYLRCASMVYSDDIANAPHYMAGAIAARFPGYFVVSYFLKEPLAAIILAGIGLVVLLRDRAMPVLNKWFLLLRPAVFLAAISYGAANHGARYLIPILPFTCLLAGLGIATLIERGRQSRACLGAAGVLCLWLVVEAVAVYPDQLSYFNEGACLLTQPTKVGLDGGSRCGVAWLDDSNVDWGQGFKQLKQWLDRNAPGRPVKLAYGMGFDARDYGIPGERISMEDLMRPPAPGLYAVSAHFVAHAPAADSRAAWLRSTPPVAVVGHALWIYEIR